MYSLDIISACFGTLNVTNQLRSLSASSSSPTYQFSFTPTVTLFGNDPLPGRKACVVVYRVRFDSLGPMDSQYGPPKVYRGLDGDAVTLYYDGQGVRPFTPGCPASNRYIVDASWYTKDVTDLVTAISNASPRMGATISVNVNQLGPDPAFGTQKQLMITYASLGADGTTSYSTILATDFDNVLLPVPAPPLLKILAVNYGGKDVTVQVRNLVKLPNQTLTLDMSQDHVAWGDPWPGVPKSFAMLYQYGNRPMALVIAPADVPGIVILDPYDAIDVSKTKFLRQGVESKVVAIVWGLMQGMSGPVGEDKYQSVTATGQLSCTNTVLGFDGWPGVSKTCVVFAHRDKWNGEIYCVGAREGDTLSL